MKKILKVLLVIAIMSPLFLFSQQSGADKLFEKYSEKTGFYYLNLETNFLSTIEDGEETKNQSEIVYLRMLTFNESENTSKDASKIYGEFIKSFDKNVYSGLIDVNSSGEKVDMMVKKEDGKVSEIIIVIFDNTETMLVSASGNFDLKKLATFKQIENCKRLGSLKKLCED